MPRRTSTKRRGSQRSRQSRVAGPIRHAPPSRRAWSLGDGRLTSWARYRGRPTWLWPQGALGLVLALAMWPAWFSQGLVIGGDLLLQHYPLQVLWRDALSSGEFPFWNAYTLSGMPAFANPLAIYAYPLHWAVLWLPADRALNWMIGLHVLLAGFGAAWCAGRLGASKEGQFLSGAVYALGSAMTQRLWPGHMNWIEADAWLPFATGLVIRQRQRFGVILLAVLVSLFLLTSRPEMFVFSIWWLPAWAALAVAGDGWRPVVLAVFRTGVGLVLGAGLGAIQALPSAAVLAVSNRQAGVSWEASTLASLPPWHLLGLVAPLVFGEPRSGTYWPGPEWEWHERLFFIGLVPLLAATRLVGRWRWACLGLAAVAVALALGGFSPWYAWVKAVVPGYGSFRVPSKHLTLAVLALALAAGLGVHRLQGRRLGLFTLGGAAIFGLASVTVSLWLPPAVAILGGSASLASPAARDTMLKVAPPALQLAAGVLVLAGASTLLPAPWALRAQLSLAVLELGLVFWPYRTNPTDPRAVVAQMSALGGHQRAAVVGPRGEIAGQLGPLLRVVQPTGYDPLVSRDYMALVIGIDQSDSVVVRIARADDPVLSLLGVEAVFEPGGALIAPRDPPQPPAWVAHCVWPGTALQVREPDFPRSACITRAAATERQRPVAPGPALVTGAKSGWLSIQAEGPGWLVTYQPWYPGWTATLDGAPVATEPVDGALTGLSLPPGAHTVELRYRPAWLEIGAGVSLGSGLALLGWFLWERRRSVPVDRADGLAPIASSA